MEDIETKNAGELGINYGNLSHSTFKNIYAHDNAENGIHGAHTQVGKGNYNTFRDIYCWNNGEYGFSDGGTGDVIIEDSHNLFDNIQCWDNASGITIVKQTGMTLSNSSAHGNANVGMYFQYLENSTINNCLVTTSGKTGLFLTTGVKNVNFTNVIVKNNGLLEKSSGIRMHDNSNVVFTSYQSYDDRETPLQTYGLYLTGTNTGISLLNCKLTPNKEGDIYNPAGAVITVIAEKKRLSRF